MSYIARLLFCVGYWLLPSLAFAEAGNLNHTSGNVWTVTAIGNGAIMYDTMLAIKGVMGSDVFNGLMLSMGLIALIVTGVAALGDFSKLSRMGLVVFGLWFVGLVTFHFKADVIIHDKMYINPSTSVIGPMDAPVIQDMPAIVVIPASLITTFGETVTNAFETQFSYPVNFKISSGAPFSLASSLLNIGSSGRITDPILNLNFQNLFNDCINVDLAMNNMSIATLLTTTNIMSALNPVQGNLITTITAATGIKTATTCKELYDSLNTTMSSATILNSMAKESGAAFLQGINSDVLAGYLNSAVNLLDSSMTGGGAIAQSAVINALMGSYESGALATGNSEMMMSLAMGQARQSQKSAWATGSEMFKELAGMTYGVLQIFLMAMTPLMMVALLIPKMGISMFSNYTKMLFWLALWEPLIAICNFIQIGYITDSGHANGGYIGWDALHIQAVSELANNASLYAGYALGLVPMISWALVKGTMAFTEFISSGVGNQFAASAASMAASGNVQLGNVNMNNTKANSMSSTFQTSIGHARSTLSSGGQSVLFDIGNTGVQHAGKQPVASRTFNSSDTNASTTDHSQRSGEVDQKSAARSIQSMTQTSAIISKKFTDNSAVTAKQGVNNTESFELGTTLGNQFTTAFSNTNSATDKTELLASAALELQSMLKAAKAANTPDAMKQLSQATKGFEASLDAFAAKNPQMAGAVSALKGLAGSISTRTSDGILEQKEEEGIVASAMASVDKAIDDVKANPGTALGYVAAGAAVGVAAFFLAAPAAVAGTAGLLTAGALQASRLLLLRGGSGGLATLFQGNNIAKATGILTTGTIFSSSAAHAGDSSEFPGGRGGPTEPRTQQGRDYQAQMNSPKEQSSGENSSLPVGADSLPAEVTNLWKGLDDNTKESVKDLLLGTAAGAAVGVGLLLGGTSLGVKSKVGVNVSSSSTETIQTDIQQQASRRQDWTEKDMISLASGLERLRTLSSSTEYGSSGVSSNSTTDTFTAAHLHNYSKENSKSYSEKYQNSVDFKSGYSLTESKVSKEALNGDGSSGISTLSQQWAEMNAEQQTVADRVSDDVKVSPGFNTNDIPGLVDGQTAAKTVNTVPIVPRPSDPEAVAIEEDIDRMNKAVVQATNDATQYGDNQTFVKTEAMLRQAGGAAINQDVTGSGLGMVDIQGIGPVSIYEGAVGETQVGAVAAEAWGSGKGVIIEGSSGHYYAISPEMGLGGKVDGNEFAAGGMLVVDLGKLEDGKLTGKQGEYALFLDAPIDNGNGTWTSSVPAQYENGQYNIQRDPNTVQKVDPNSGHDAPELDFSRFNKTFL